MRPAGIRRAVVACVMLWCRSSRPGMRKRRPGRFLGTIVDQTGAVLPGVKVVAVNVDTNQRREVVTNSTGRYRSAFRSGITTFPFGCQSSSGSRRVESICA